MNKVIQNEYLPDYVSPPGETLEEELEAREMTQAELARRMGRPTKTINEIIQGKAEIMPDTALQLERVLGISANFWNNLESQYRESLARHQEKKQLQNQVAWLKEVPLEEMVKRGWLVRAEDMVEQVRLLLQFFAVASVDQWHILYDEPTAAFRRSKAFKADRGAVAAWLRWGQLLAQQISCAPYNVKAFREALSSIRSLTNTPFKESRFELARQCAAVGVAVVFVEELPRTCAWGATRWLSPHKALIQISSRYKTEDYLWFTFFHEAGHILLHGKQDVFLEVDERNSDKEVEEKSAKEVEANDFAANELIPSSAWTSFVQAHGYSSKAGIEAFARKVGVAPGIVVGRLHHEKHLRHSYYNSLKRKLIWPRETAETESDAA